MEKKKQKYFVLITVILIASVLGMWLANHRMKNLSSLPILADIGTDFKLTAAGNARVRLQDYRNQIVIVFFGYTSCPDVCPTSLYTLKHVMNKLGKDSEQVQVFMITVDPERDSAERLREYTQHFHPDFIGLTGTLNEITKVAKTYLTEFRKEPPTPDGNYQVTHSAFFYLLDKQGQVRALHDPTSTPEKIAADVYSLLAERKGFIF